MYLYPVAYSAWVSVYEWDLATPARYVGLQNYRALWSAEFGEVVANTVWYSVGVVVLSQALGLALALALNNRTRLGALFQASIFSSYVVSWVAVSLLWIWLLDPQYQTAEEAIQLLPDPMFEKRLLSVDRNKFTLGIPDKDAFALRQVPQGTPIPYTPALRQAASTKTFDAQNVPEIEATLLAAAMKARK